MGLAFGIGEPRTATELAGERLGQIGVEYMALMRKNPSDAEVYKKAIVTAVSRKDSAVWNAKETERIFGKFFDAAEAIRHEVCAKQEDICDPLEREDLRASDCDG